MDTDQLLDVVADHRHAGLDEVDVAVMDLAEKVAGDATAVTQEDVDRLRSLGLSDRDVFDVVAAAAVRCFFSTVARRARGRARRALRGARPAAARRAHGRPPDRELTAAARRLQRPGGGCGQHRSSRISSSESSIVNAGRDPGRFMPRPSR